MRELTQMEADFEAANIRVGEATWNIYSGEAEADLDGAQQQLAQVLMNPRNRATVEKGLATVDREREPLLARRLAVWRNCFNGSAVDNVPEIYSLKNRLQQRIASFEFELDGKPILRSQLQAILRNEPDRELRRKAWLATSALAAANREDLPRLIQLRNQAARELGYQDYPDLVFTVQELDKETMQQVLERLSTDSLHLYSDLIDSLRKELGVPQLAPWDVQYGMRKAFHLPDRYFPRDQLLATLHRTAESLGFAVDRLPIRTLIRDIPFGGYNVAVKIPEDTRFLVNPSDGQGFYTTAFHEYGHSLQAVFTAVEWPILKEYEWVTGGHSPAYSEGMAEVMGEFARRGDWLAVVAGVSAEEIESYIKRLLPAQMVMRLFELLFNLRVELAAYADPSGDIASVERLLIREVRQLELSAREPTQWEANTWYTSYPVYWHNYILASVIASQIHATITTRFGENASSNREVAEYLRAQFYASGNSLPWMERIQRGTGALLSPDPYLQRLIMIDN